MKRPAVTFLTIPLLAGMAFSLAWSDAAAQSPAPKKGLTKATPPSQPGQPGGPGGTAALSMPTPVGGPAPGGIPGGYGPGAISPVQLPQFARPNLAVYFPFDRDCFNINNPLVPGDLGGGHIVYNSGAYSWPGRLRDGFRFGVLALGAVQPMFLAVSPSPLTSDLAMNQGCTIAAWVLPERVGGLNGSTNQTILCRGVTDQENTVSYCLGLTSANVPFFEGRVPANWPQPGPWKRQATRAVGGSWQHVSVIFNAGAVTFYINGQAAGVSQAPARALDAVRYMQSPAYVGTRFVSDVTGEIRDPYYGALDDVALWSRPLLPRDVALLASDNDGNGIADYWDFQITGHLPAPNPNVTSGPITPPTPTPHGFSILKGGLRSGSPPSPEYGRPPVTPTPRSLRNAPRMGPGGPESAPGGPQGPSVVPGSRREDRPLAPSSTPQPPGSSKGSRPTPTPTPTPTPSNVRRIQ